MSIERHEPAQVPERLNGNFVVEVGGYETAGLILHVAATVVTLGAWLPVFVTYLIGWRKRIITVHIMNGVVMRVGQ
jgi:uncharacterized membrane protein